MITTLPIGVFNGGASPLMRMGSVHALVTNQEGSASAEARLAALVQSHPIFVLQFGLMLYLMLNFVLERCTPSTALAQVMRVQALVCSFFLQLLDCLGQMRTTGAVTLSIPPHSPTPTLGDDTDTDAAVQAQHPTPTPGSHAPEVPELKRFELSSLPATAELLTRARADMAALAQTRSGQGVGYALLALCCGAPSHCVLPIALGGSVFLFRAAGLVAMSVVPCGGAILGAGAGAVRDGGAKKGKKSKQRQATSSSSHPVLRLLFPFPLAATSPTLNPETLDVLADFAAFPVEFFVTRGWSKQAPAVSVGAKFKPCRPKGTPQAAAEEAAANVAATAAAATTTKASSVAVSDASQSAAAVAVKKVSTLGSVAHFLAMMLKGMVLMALLKTRLRGIVEFIDPAPEGGLGLGVRVGGNGTNSSALGGVDFTPGVAVSANAAPFFMSQWAFFKDPIVRNVLGLVRQMLSPEGVTSISSRDMGPAGEEGVGKGGGDGGEGGEVADVLLGDGASDGSAVDGAEIVELESNVIIENVDGPGGVGSTAAVVQTMVARRTIKSGDKGKGKGKVGGKGGGKEGAKAADRAAASAVAEAGAKLAGPALEAPASDPTPTCAHESADPAPALAEEGISEKAGSGAEAAGGQSQD